MSTPGIAMARLHAPAAAIAAKAGWHFHQAQGTQRIGDAERVGLAEKSLDLGHHGIRGVREELGRLQVLRVQQQLDLDAITDRGGEPFESAGHEPDLGDGHVGTEADARALAIVTNVLSTAGADNQPVTRQFDG